MGRGGRQSIDTRGGDLRAIDERGNGGGWRRGRFLLRDRRQPAAGPPRVPPVQSVERRENVRREEGPRRGGSQVHGREAGWGLEDRAGGHTLVRVVSLLGLVVRHPFEHGVPMRQPASEREREREGERERLFLVFATWNAYALEFVSNALDSYAREDF